MPALWWIHTLEGLLYGVTPSDPATAGAAALFVFAVAAVASALPAYRAARTEPLTVLRVP